MKTKYYTPEIEEFHVGFEYEIKFFVEKQKPNEDLFNYLRRQSKNKIEWQKQIWTDTSSFVYVMNVENDGQGGIKSITVPDSIRVKHLDREDIEELGWASYKFIDSEPVLNFKLGEYNMIYAPVNEFSNSSRISIKKYEDFNWFFRGNIKNKSELKRLMKQLRIE